ncbi:unnamed protein product [Gadus morhua 'NCC']
MQGASGAPWGPYHSPGADCYMLLKHAGLRVGAQRHGAGPPCLDYLIGATVDIKYIYNRACTSTAQHVSVGLPLYGPQPQQSLTDPGDLRSEASLAPLEELHIPLSTTTSPPPPPDPHPSPPPPLHPQPLSTTTSPPPPLHPHPLTTTTLHPQPLSTTSSSDLGGREQQRALSSNLMTKNPKYEISPSRPAKPPRLL